jgi:hypothetical protein
MTNSAAYSLPATFFAPKFPLPSVPHDPTHAIEIKYRLAIAAAFLQNKKRIFPELREQRPAQSPSNPCADARRGTACAWRKTLPPEIWPMSAPRRSSTPG